MTIELKKSQKFTIDESLYSEFCARFPYNETEDQLNAIAQIEEDFNSGKSMDRLICGDVGFCKTEVAISAAFKAASEGKQVAVLVPTTILAMQHYRTFSERLANLPLKEIITTDSVPIPFDMKAKIADRLTVLSVAPLLGEVIRRAHEGRSVGEMFDE